MASDMPLALIVDDHPLFCDALALTLRSIAEFEQVEAVHRLEDALGRIERDPAPSVIFLDLDLPDVEGIDGLLRLRAVTSAAVVVVSSMAEERVITACFAAGAQGFVPKHSGREAFRAAFQAIEAGERSLPEGYTAPEEGEATTSAETFARLALLTRQQARILELICQGMLNKQIAYDLSIAETTVKAHVTAIMRKLGVQSRTQAVLVAQQARFSHLLPSG